MKFDANTIAKIAPFLEYNDIAEVSFNTLFVACSERTARQVYHVISRDAGIGKVKILKTPAEYIFDIVA